MKERSSEGEPCEPEGSGRADLSCPQILWVAEAPRRMTWRNRLSLHLPRNPLPPRPRADQPTVLLELSGDGEVEGDRVRAQVDARAQVEPPASGQVDLGGLLAQEAGMGRIGVPGAPDKALVDPEPPVLDLVERLPLPDAAGLSAPVVVVHQLRPSERLVIVAGIR